MNSSLSGRPSRWWRPASENFDLRYLGWGGRYYGRVPRALKKRSGWPYILIAEGTPELLRAGKAIRLGPGEMVLFPPGASMGLEDDLDARCEVFSWIWESPPRCEECVADPDGFVHVRLAGGEIAEMREVHEACRREVLGPDRFTPRALEYLRLRLDVGVARARGASVGARTADRTFTLAREWMEANLAAPGCAGILGDYLQVSSSALYQMFLRRTGRSPNRYFRDLRMRAAREMLARDGLSVKEVAHKLGYHHPNDFSRAFKAALGASPHSVSKTPGTGGPGGGRRRPGGR